VNSQDSSKASISTAEINPILQSIMTAQQKLMDAQNDFLAGKITTYRELNESLSSCRVKFSKKQV